MKYLSILGVFSFMMILVSCGQSPLVEEAQPKTVALNGNCTVNQAYLDDLADFLAGHYGVQSSEVSVSYTGQGNQYDHEFPFSISSSTVNGTGLVGMNDLCTTFAADIIVEEDLAGF